MRRYRTALIGMFAAVLCGGVTARPVFARSVSHGALEICNIIDGGWISLNGGVETCCATITSGTEKGRYKCVSCDPPGSDNCTEWYEGKTPTDELTSLVNALVADQRAIFEEQQRVRTSLEQVLAGLGNLQARIDDVQAAYSPADLLPVALPGSAAADFCKGDDHGNLLVRVKNQGSIEAPASTLRVTFKTPSGPLSADVSTPPVAGGELIDLEVPIPRECLLRGSPVPSACNFQVAADADDVVVESHQENNGASGVCTPAK
jgi:hypothetical protein